MQNPTSAKPMTMTRHGRFLLRAWLGLLLAFAMPAAPARAAEAYSFAVAPQFERHKLFAIWNPIVEEVQRRSGVKLRLMATLTMPEYEKGMPKGAFDFVYANPYHIYHEAHGQGYIPLVRDSTPLRGILVVRKDSPLRDVRELNGKVLAVPSPNALGASLLLRAELERLHHVSMRPLYVKTHSSVYLHVANGLVDAGGGVEKTLAEEDAAVKDRLRVLYTTQTFVSHPVAAHPRVPAEVREKIRRALLDMDATPEGHRLLAAVPFKKPIATSLRDYEPLQQLHLESYWVNEEKQAP